MGEIRRAERKVLCYYLRVIDQKTGKILGRVVDITGDGLMLLSEKPLDRTKPYSIRVLLNKDLFDTQLGNLDVLVNVRWSRPDANPSLVITGLLFLDLDEKGKKIVKNLVDKIGMNRRLDLSEEDIENGILDEEDYF